MNRLYIITAAIAVVLILIFTNFGQGTVRVYDCGMAEWHPDIPTQVREECRRLHYEQWKEEQKRLLTT
jgi:hypothetical protein